jgi:hypothetical protein
LNRDYWLEKRPALLDPLSQIWRCSGDLRADADANNGFSITQKSALAQPGRAPLPMMAGIGTTSPPAGARKRLRYSAM